MKKTLIALFCVAIMVCLALSMSAANATLSAGATETVVERGDSITIAYNLSGTPALKTMGIDFDIDTNVFKIVSGSWVDEDDLDASPNTVKVLIDDFIKGDQNGVFTLAVRDDEDEDISGLGVDCNTTIFKIKLTVLDNASFGDSTVACSLIAKEPNGADIPVTPTATVIKVTHDHVWDSTFSRDDESHWKSCGVSGCDEKKEFAAHTFDNACDTTCNGGCGFTRVTSHTPETAWQRDNTNHWHNCANCGTPLTKTNHAFDNACDQDCNDGCGFTRPTSHTPETAWQRDNTNHWHNCGDCGQPVNKVAHKFDNACDTDCNDGCGFTRVTTHNYATAWSRDNDNHWHECSECHAKKDLAAHKFDNNCDTTCNDGCGFTRSTSHTPETAWQRDNTNHWHNCGDCGQPVNAAAHTFDNACDTTCNGGCGFTRTTTHDYATAWSTDGTKHWHECNECHAKKDEAAHSGGTATCKAKAKCTECNTEYGNLAEHKAANKVDAEYLVSKADCVNKAVYKKSCEICEKTLDDTFITGEVDENNHVDEEPVIKNAEPATCTAPGFTGDKYCAGCDAKLEDGEPIPEGHKLKKVEAKPAECTEDGNIEYYECEGSCGKLYKDAEATTEIEKADTVVKETGHSIKKVEKVDSTTEKTGTEEHYKCETCEKLYKDAEGKTEITDPDTLIIPKKKPTGTPQTGSDIAIIVVAVIALVGSVAAIPAVVSKKR